MYTNKKFKFIVIVFIEDQCQNNIFGIMDEHISLIIKNLDPAKAHGCGNISVKMTKVCSESLTVTLKIIFEQSLKEGSFQQFGKSKCCSGTQKRR